MADHDEHSERALIEKLATAALIERRRACRWDIFFRLLTLDFIAAVLALAVD